VQGIRERASSGGPRNSEKVGRILRTRDCEWNYSAQKTDSVAQAWWDRNEKDLSENNDVFK
jgi:hypothetical protein